PNTLTPIGVRMPVVSMSIRFLMGMVQAFVVPGKCMAASISLTSSSYESRSGQMRLSTSFLSHSGDHFEYQRSLGRHSKGGFRLTTVSTIDSGAGSVEVSARPALPCTCTTSGKDISTRSWACSDWLASATELPGSVVGMYR